MNQVHKSGPSDTVSVEERLPSQGSGRGPPNLGIEFSQSVWPGAEMRT